MRTAGTTVLALALLSHPAAALWPFQQKRFTAEAFVDAGSLGVNTTGRVVALGDWDGDQK
jgi:integrin alpha FG-GAP repeat containing protein 1